MVTQIWWIDKYLPNKLLGKKAAHIVPGISDRLLAVFVKTLLCFILLRSVFLQKIMTYLFDFPHGPKVRSVYVHLPFDHTLSSVSAAYWWRLKKCFYVHTCMYDLLLVCVHVSILHSPVPPTDPGSPTLIWSWWTPGSLCSLLRVRCSDKSTRWADTAGTEIMLLISALHLNAGIFRMNAFQLQVSILSCCQSLFGSDFYACIQFKNTAAV